MGNHGSTLTPSLNADDDIELVVTATQTAGGIAVPAHYRYRARIRGLAAGEYSLRIAHRVGGEGQEETQFEGMIEVP